LPTVQNTYRCSHQLHEITTSYKTIMSSKNNINVGEQARLYDKQQPIELKKTKHFLISRRSASAPARLSHQNDRRSAMSTVFGINELLTQILSDVPMEHFVNLLRVSKTWNSVALKIGYYIEPTYVCTETYLPWIFQKPPVYPDNVHIDINPIVQCGNRYEAWNYELHRWDMNFRVDGKFFSSVLCRFGHQFLTNPPITHISISYATVTLMKR